MKDDDLNQNLYQDRDLMIELFRNLSLEACFQWQWPSVCWHVRRFLGCVQGPCSWILVVMKKGRMREKVRVQKVSLRFCPLQRLLKFHILIELKYCYYVMMFVGSSHELQVMHVACAYPRPRHLLSVHKKNILLNDEDGSSYLGKDIHTLWITGSNNENNRRERSGHVLENIL